MIQVSYISSAASPVSTEQLLSLLQQCLRNNPGKDITGMLLYGNETFLQTLEGEEAVVDRLVEKIRGDARHHDVRILNRRPIEQRQYRDWTMGFKMVSDGELRHIEGLREFGAKDFNFEYLATHEAVVETLMNHFRAPHWDPLIRELDAKDKVIEHLRKALTQARSRLDIASLVLESVRDAGGKGELSARHLRLCDSALESLRKT